MKKKKVPLNSRQERVLSGLSSNVWKRPAEIPGYHKLLYGALQQLVKKKLVEVRLRQVGTGDSREYRKAETFK